MPDGGRVTATDGGKVRVTVPDGGRVTATDGC